MNLFDQLNQYDQTEEPPPPPDFTCRIKSTRTGRQIMLCSKDPAPQAAIDQANRASLPLFVASEIDQMRDIDPKTLTAIITAKKAFPGCEIQQVIREANSQ